MFLAKNPAQPLLACTPGHINGHVAKRQTVGPCSMAPAPVPLAVSRDPWLTVGIHGPARIRWWL
jgi:hypothetical protein